MFGFFCSAIDLYPLGLLWDFFNGRIASANPILDSSLSPAQKKERGRRGKSAPPPLRSTADASAGDYRQEGESIVAVGHQPRCLLDRVWASATKGRRARSECASAPESRKYAVT